MISADKIESQHTSESVAVNTSKANNKWNEQPHIGKYKLIKTIGKGNFAKVKLAQHVTTGKKVAVKVIDKTALNKSSADKLFREVKIMKAIDHPNIVKLFEVIESERHVYLVMEYASKGEVFDYLVQNGRMKEKDARQRFREIVSAIQYCHQKQIVHRDLKAENLLLNNDLQIKIADFGFANTFDSKKQLDTFCGSPPYAAPELFQGRKYEGPEVDVWSLGVILYTLVSGSLPFDGHNMRELRERVLKGKYRIPFYMSTDCESLLKKMLIVNPQKRYTLIDVMKDKWVNIGFEDNILQPYMEPKKNYEDPVKLAMMDSLGFSKDEVLDSLYNAKFNNVTATYLLLDLDLNNTLEISSKSDNGRPLKSANNLVQKDQSKHHTIVSVTGNETSSITIISGSESRTNSKINCENKESVIVNDNKIKHTIPFSDAEETNIGENSFKIKLARSPTCIKPSRPSVTQNSAHSNDEDLQLDTTSSTVSRLRPNAIRIPGIQPTINLLTQKSSVEKNDLNNTDHLAIPVKTTTWVKRNNTFTYPDKNTTSEMESKPVTRTKNVMNILSHVTPATVPIPIDPPILPQTSHSKKYTVSDINSKSSKKSDPNKFLPNKVCPNNNDVSKSDSNCDIELSVNEKSDVVNGENISKNHNTSQNDMAKILRPEIEENDNHIQTLLDKNSTISNNIGGCGGVISVYDNKNKPELYPPLNKPKQIHSHSLFRSFTSKISTNKLFRRLTNKNIPSNKNKHNFLNEEVNHDQNNVDPWTPMEIEDNDKRKISAAPDLTVDLSLDHNKAYQNISKSNQNKPRIMHLGFRKSLTSKLQPVAIISEMMKYLQASSDEIEFSKIQQINTFVIECQGRLKSEHGGNELIHWEIEVFRLPKSSSFGIRIKKQSGSSTRFKAIHKILISKLSLVLCANMKVTSTN